MTAVAAPLRASYVQTKASPVPFANWAACSGQSLAISGRLFTVPTIIAGRSSGRPFDQLAEGEFLPRDAIEIRLQFLRSEDFLLDALGAIQIQASEKSQV